MDEEDTDDFLNLFQTHWNQTMEYEERISKGFCTPLFKKLTNILKAKYVFIEFSQYLPEKGCNELNKLLSSKKIPNITIQDLLNHLPRSNEISSEKQQKIEKVIKFVLEKSNQISEKESILILSMFIKFPKYQRNLQKLNTSIISLELWYSLILQKLSKYLTDSYEQMGSHYGEHFSESFCHLKFAKEFRNKIVSNMTKEDYETFSQLKFSKSSSSDDNFTSFWNQFEDFFLPKTYFTNLIIFFISRNFLVFNILDEMAITLLDIQKSFIFTLNLLKEKNYSKMKKLVKKKISQFNLDFSLSQKLLETILTEIRIFFFIKLISEASFDKIEMKRNQLIESKPKKYLFEKEHEILEKFGSMNESLPEILDFECDKYLWKLERNISIRMGVLNIKNEPDDVVGSMKYFMTKIAHQPTIYKSISPIVCRFVSYFFVDGNYEYFLKQMKMELKSDYSIDQIERILTIGDAKKSNLIPNLTYDSIQPFIYEELVVLISSFQLFTSTDSYLVDLNGTKSKSHYKDVILEYLNSKIDEGEFVKFLDEYSMISSSLKKNFSNFIEKEKKLRNDEIKKKKYEKLDNLFPQWNDIKSNEEEKNWVFIDGNWIEDDDKNEWKFDFFTQKWTLQDQNPEKFWISEEESVEMISHFLNLISQQKIWHFDENLQ
eukprot:gene11570-4816_t